MSVFGTSEEEDRATFPPPRMERDVDPAHISLERLIAMSPLIIFERTAGNVVTYVSPNVERILGYTPEEVAGPNFWPEHIPPEDRDAFLAETQRAMARRAAEIDREFRFLHKDGRDRWLHATVRLTYDETGEPTGLVGFAIDVTARKSAEERLRRSELFLDSVVENIPDMILVKDAAELRFVRFNRAGEQLLGYSRDELIGKNDSDFFPTEEADFFAAKDREVLEGGKLLDIPEEPIETKHGPRILRTKKVPILGEEGRPEYLLGISEDITERKRVQEALRESEERLRSILQTATDAFIAIDASGAITDWNPAAETTLGWAREDVLGRPLAETIIPERYRRDHERGLAHFMATGDGPVFYKRLELAALHGDGREIPVELTIWPLRLPDGWSFNAFVRDISERRKLEELREQSRRDAAAHERERAEAERRRVLDEMKSAFLTALSHELRTPLTSVLGFARTLERVGPDVPPEKQREFLGRMASNAERLERILEDILDLERLSRGTAEPQRRPTEISGVVRRVAESVGIAGGGPVEIDVEPAAAATDPEAVERIVTALLDNTAKHTPPGTPVWVRVRAEAGGALIIVEDAGPGVPDVLKEFVFKPFERGLDAPAHSPGTGIGLTLVAALAGLSGGRAWVEDRPGGGASFRVFLPGESSERGRGPQRLPA